MTANFRNNLEHLIGRQLSPMDLLPHDDLREKLVELVLFGEPVTSDIETNNCFQQLRRDLLEKRTDHAKVVVFGGGTGLSNIIGGDSRSNSWPLNPFTGLKEIFPLSRSVVCITDDGGSTGELLKDLPLIALGDIRHVLLSSVQLSQLQALYGLNSAEAKEVVGALAALFNYRFYKRPGSVSALYDQSGFSEFAIPDALAQGINSILATLFSDARLAQTLKRPHCLGNLLLAAVIYQFIDPGLSNKDLASLPTAINYAVTKGLNKIATLIGASSDAVLPCTTTAAQLQVLYTNGVQVTGEYKSGHARRGYPVDRVVVQFSGSTGICPGLLESIRDADVLIMAPGSLYSSIIPVFQVPGLADAVRANRKAMKLLIANIWVQAGETDLTVIDPHRKFQVSDMISAYDRNIPGGVEDLFSEVLCLSLKDVSASVLQRYAVEGKVPIYLDRDRVRSQGFIPIECGIFSRSALAERGVIQHDPQTLASVVKTLLVVFQTLRTSKSEVEPVKKENIIAASNDSTLPAVLPMNRHQRVAAVIGGMAVHLAKNTEAGKESEIRHHIADILWRHPDIRVRHLDYVKSIRCVTCEAWSRNQKWDKIFSFYDPQECCINIREDQFEESRKFEIAFLVALGQSLLGNYASEKKMVEIPGDDGLLGKVYNLHLQGFDKRKCFFSEEQLFRYLVLTRMVRSSADDLHFTRLINGQEGFTPPGLLMGLTYAWYLDNRMATHIEYKMSVMRVDISDLIPEQVKMQSRRERLISFFREVVFGYGAVEN